MISKFEIHEQKHKNNKDISFYDVVRKYLEITSLNNFVFIDGGSGIGKVGNKVKTISDEMNQPCQIHLVEPLPENLQVLNQLYINNKDFFIHDVALSNKSGEASFAIPNRLKAQQGKWLKNSSSGGTLVNDKGIEESITVGTARLEDIVPDQVNILKLDLQGGEYDALQGYSQKLKDVDIIYIEHSIRRNLEKVLTLIPDNFDIVFDTLMGGVIGKQIPLDIIRADGIEIDDIHIGLFGQSALIYGHFTDNRWDLSKWENEKELLANERKYRLSWIAFDVFLINKNLKNTELLFS